MTWTYHIYVEVSDFINGLKHIRLKWSDYIIVIVSQCFHIIVAIYNLGSQYRIQTVVRTEGITCNQSFILNYISVHAVWPVEILSSNELQSFISQ